MKSVQVKDLSCQQRRKFGKKPRGHKKYLKYGPAAECPACWSPSCCSGQSTHWGPAPSHSMSHGCLHVLGIAGVKGVADKGSAGFAKAGLAGCICTPISGGYHPAADREAAEVPAQLCRTELALGVLPCTPQVGETPGSG